MSFQDRRTRGTFRMSKRACLLTWAQAALHELSDESKLHSEGHLISGQKHFLESTTVAASGLLANRNCGRLDFIRSSDLEQVNRFMQTCFDMSSMTGWFTLISCFNLTSSVWSRCLLLDRSSCSQRYVAGSGSDHSFEMVGELRKSDFNIQSWAGRSPSPPQAPFGPPVTSPHLKSKHKRSQETSTTFPTCIQCPKHTHLSHKTTTKLLHLLSRKQMDLTIALAGKTHFCFS